jgi:LysR family glycine cleavage system transcriptional activator
MSDRLPPLTALRAFEAAARHLSFAQAAAELHVTPAALSFQIKSLEEHLGHPLFHRLNRAVALTEAGRALLPGASEGFTALAMAWRAARRVTESQRLTVTAGPAFTAKWLAPRLFDFAQKHPGIELRFSASLRLMDFDRDEIDGAIRYGMGSDEGLYSRPLMDEWLTPMMAPALVADYPDAASLAGAVLLHQDDIAFMRPRTDWSAWFKAAGLGEAPRGGPRFSQADHALDAAITGGGVILGRLSLARGALRDGTLIAPFPLALRTPAKFRFVCPEGTETRPQVAAFLDWLLAEIGCQTDLVAGRHIVDPV